MPILAIGPLGVFAALLVAAAFLGVGGAVWVTVWIAQAAKRRQLGDNAEREHLIATGDYPAWREGHDLLRYPERLGDLEDRLADSYTAATIQATHLRSRGQSVGVKDDRAELVERYEFDAASLDTRALSMQRVLALVWRTRAVLLLRAHVAITARARPALSGLPEGDIPVDGLPAAAETYDAAAASVRDFVMHVEARAADLNHMVPSPPVMAELSSEDRPLVDGELARARATYVDLQNQMDRLADTLSYLADRCHTRKVVEAARVGVSGAPGTAALMDDVGEALRALEGLAELGDQQLADNAMDNLAEDISQLEQAGLEARAEADAALEVSRLLEQFGG
jgi:hypothetical protein